jgi:MFS family permease
VLYSLLLVGAVVGPLLAGWLSDRFGRRRTLVVYYLLSALGVLAFLGAGSNLVLLVPLLLPFGTAVFSESPVLQAFLADRASVAGYVRPLLDTDEDRRPEVWNALAQLGVVGLLVPESYGGAGMGMVDAAVVLEEMGRAVHPSPYIASAIGAISLVRDAGSEREHSFLLPGMASGSVVGTVALLEPGRRFEIDEPLVAVGAALGTDPLRFVLTGGDDHALVATFPASVRLPDEWRVIGSVTARSEQETVGVSVDGAAYEGPAGHTHF